MEDFVVQTNRLSLGYGHQGVLQDVNVRVGVGEFWFFLGPNGEGKTTLLKGLLGGLKPAEGEIVWNPKFSGRERIGFVPQRCDLNPALPTTVREFVLLGLVGIRGGKKDHEERLSFALNKVGLSGMAEKNYWSLSGGQRQRALLARALVRRPSLLILDEPSNGLDLAAEDALLRSLAKLNRQENLTILFVTHELDLAARFATHVALFHAGRVEAGPHNEVLNRESLERTYGVPVAVHQDPSGAIAVQVGEDFS